MRRVIDGNIGGGNLEGRGRVGLSRALGRGFLAVSELVIVMAMLAAWTTPAIYRACTEATAMEVLYVQAADIRWFAGFCGYVLGAAWLVREASDWPARRARWPWLLWGLAVAWAAAAMLLGYAALGPIPQFH